MAAAPPPAAPPPPPTAPIQGWEIVGPSGRFHQIALPMSDEAIRLNSDERRFIFYAEFDTILEEEAWLAYLKDPLKMLTNENVWVPSAGNLHLGINILKLEGKEGDYGEGYKDPVERRGEGTARLLKEYGEPDRKLLHISTTVLNHEIALNPRIGIT